MIEPLIVVWIVVGRGVDFVHPSLLLYDIPEMTFLGIIICLVVNTNNLGDRNQAGSFQRRREKNSNSLMSCVPHTTSIDIDQHAIGCDRDRRRFFAGMNKSTRPTTRKEKTPKIQFRYVSSRGEMISIKRTNGWANGRADGWMECSRV